ncbi:putative nuclear migration protein [Xylariales sp. AK1849]|nr:putative nuclear migration protein [Xylariales sp. AK1849]
MASIATDELTSAAPAMDDHNDPFITSENSPAEREPRHRYSTFNSHLFALGPNASPGQAKRALEAHLAETDRRMEEAGKLGTALVQQRKDLTERLKDVEKLQAEGELSQDLRLKLVEIEKDYNDVARESARAFLPKPRVPSNEAAAGSPFVPEGKGGRRSVSPSKFEAQATGSPTKFSVPNRKLRNQPANRIHDIEFAAEISQSLIAQVRNLQALLAEKEEELRDVKLDKSKLEYDAEGFQQRVKTLDESENRYKDENWSLETQIHELLASQRESADREKKLQQTVNLLQSEKNSAQRELDEVKLSHSKLSEDHAAAIKHHDTEIGAAKRNIVMADSEKVAMLRKIDDLTGQNQELAKAVASQRGRTSDRQEILGMSDEDFETANDNNTPEHSPPPSPVKGTPRHSLLESETIKTSLHHAQRTIQSLRNNVHREKTEKLELRRMLQDARDELEKVRSDPLGGSKRSSKTSSREFKKPPRLLGGLRSARSEIFAEDPSWEDHPESSSPTTLSQRSLSNFEPVMESTENEQFDTANETSDQGFQTANERGTDTEAFHTGAEEFSSDEDIQTETDSPTKRRTLKGRPPGLPMGLARSSSVHSTASTEDEYTFEDMRTPTSQLPALHNKFPLRVSRGAFRRSRQASEDPTFQSSPASFANSAGGTPQPVQSLAAELGDFDGSDNESNLSATPSRRASRPGSYRGTTASPPPPVPRLPKVILVDSGMMTDPLPELTRRVGHERPMSMNTVVSGLSSEYSDSGALEENLAKFPSPPTSPPKRDFSFSDVHAHEVEPLESFKAALAKQVESSKSEGDVAHSQQIEAMNAANVEIVEAHKRESEKALEEVSVSAKASQERQIEALKSEHAAARSKELDELVSKHDSGMDALRAEFIAVKAKELEELSSQHAHPQCAETSAETQKLLTGHALELEALRKSMAIARPTLGYSSLSTVETEPIEEPELLRSPKREGFIIPRESEQLQTPFGKRGKGIAIAEDETRQSLSAANGPETPESQRPLKEMSTNTDARLRKRAPPAVDESSQTMLTSDGIDQLLLKSQRRASQDSFTVTTNQGEAIVTPFDDGTPSTVRHRRSQEIIGSPSRTGGKDSGLILTPAPIPFRRPGSSGSARSSQQTMPPLPANHREAIEAARTGSFSEAKGIMGPPLLPASAYKNPAARPRTPRDRPLSPQSARGTPTLRPMHTGSTQGYAEVHSPTRIPARSRQSSVTSFASEVDTRFNIRGEMGMDAAGFAGPNTDPRMIQAITQTMIGEYLWKYTRKAGRGEMSENRHRRYFWVHPYTRTLYWSDRDPSAAGRSELKAKSVPIEAVRVVTDDNPMPPGLHRKSLVIISPGRTIKFTCTTGQRHETWFNALSYLLLRTGNEGHNDAEEIAGNITQEDVDEFNPTFGRRPVNGNRRAPPSLSSYNSRTTRGYDSPNIDMSMSIPTLTPTHEKAAPRPGTLSRLSGYWKSGTSTSGGMFGSLRSRSHTAHNLGSAIYEASEVNDSAEELRQMIEQQDRESDRLENVRACCDGKHDVGTLSHSSKRHGHGHSHSHSHTHPGQSTTPTPMSTLRLRAA